MSTPVTLSALQLLPLLRGQPADCTELGVHLKLDYARLTTLQSQSMAQKPPMVCFTEMCNHWLKNAEDRTWSVVYTALEQQGNKALVVNLSKKYHPATKVDLPLDEFKKALDVMAHKWYLLGGALRIPVDILNRIEACRGGLDRYRNDVLEEWLNTGAATWEKLQTALIEVGNRRLAEDLEEHKKKDLLEQQKRKEQKLKEETDSKKTDSMETDLISEPREAKANVPVSSDKYACQVFYQRRKNNILATFAIVPRDKLDGLKDHEEEQGPSCTFDLETEKVEIAPKDQAGWCSKVTRKEVSKMHVDQYTGAGKPPSCEMRITPTSSETTPPDLAMEVEVKPAKMMKLEQRAENVTTQAASYSTRTRAQ